MKRDAHMQSHAGVRARTKTHSRVRSDGQGRGPIKECEAEMLKESRAGKAESY